MMRNRHRNCTRSTTRAIVICWLGVFLCYLAQAQQRSPEESHRALAEARTDSARYQIYASLTFYYQDVDPDSAIYYFNKRIEAARNSGKLFPEAFSFHQKGILLIRLHQYGEAYLALLAASAIASDPATEQSYWHLGNETNPYKARIVLLSGIHMSMGYLFGMIGNHEQQLAYFSKVRKIFGRDSLQAPQILAHLIAYYQRDELDSALLFGWMGNRIYSQDEIDKKALSNVHYYLGMIHLRKGTIDSATYYFHSGLAVGIVNQVGRVINWSGLCLLHLGAMNRDSSLWYARKAVDESTSVRDALPLENKESLLFRQLAESYSINHQADSAMKYFALAGESANREHAERVKNINEFQNLLLKEEARLRNLESEAVAYRSNVRLAVSLSAASLLLLLAVIFFRSNRRNKLAKQKTEEALHALQATQQQLIQAEKMASLGELTAGIAHEIQNPLNFVNNFSEVNNELIEDLHKELAAGSSHPDSYRNAEEILIDIRSNSEKINHHGKRAGDIVKSMLQHSRTSSGKKELTDINALADEYLRLAYHGLRAKDKSFNAKFETHLDPTLPRINVVPQEIGRVILNLINNAFYSVSEKQNDGLAGYQPTVTVSTHYSLSPGEGKGEAIIIVKDNGKGIPSELKNKIFQPFFTTKPTGKGTGLGLSLSYDIITKGHEGQIKVESREGEGTSFIIILPIK